MREQGIRPDLIVSTDINIHGGILLPEASESIRLVYFPMVNPEVLSAWLNPTMAFVTPDTVPVNDGELVGARRD